VPARDPLDAAVAAARRHLAELPELPVRPGKAGPEVSSLLPPELPDSPGDPASTIDALVATVDGGLLATASPRFFGWVVGGTLPVPLAADRLVSSWDSVGGISAAAPALARIEEQTGRWMPDLLGLPRGASFGFTTGCQAAHVAARHELLRRRGIDAERAGLAGSPPRLHVLAADDRHVTIDLARRYLGIGTDALTVLPSDEQGRVHPSVFEEALRADESAPTIIVAQADPNAWVTEYSRRARAIPVWAALRTLGRSGVANLVYGLHERAQQFAELLRDHPGIVILNDVVFKQVLVRFRDSDEVTRSVIAAAQREGTMWLCGSQWHNQLVARISVCNHATNALDVERSAKALLASFEAVALAGS
jgi:glutamate/tyrosine decarboxylase-like PLP-dependent enzyme